MDLGKVGKQSTHSLLILLSRFQLQKSIDSRKERGAPTGELVYAFNVVASELGDRQKHMSIICRNERVCRRVLRREGEIVLRPR